MSTQSPLSYRRIGPMCRSRWPRVEQLESRRLFAAADLVAALPQTEDFINTSFSNVADVDGQLFATTLRTSAPERLWALDVASSPTPLFTSATHPGGDERTGISALTSFHGKLFFFGNGPTSDGLYQSDGTVGGTVSVKVLRQGTNVLPHKAFVLDDRLYFFWNDANQVTLWSSDGTEPGTQPVWSLPSGMGVGTVSDVIDGHVFFGAGGQLWRTDGTAQETSSLWAGLPSWQYPGWYTVAGQKLFFVTDGTAPSPRRLYVADLDGTNVTQVPIPWGNGGTEPSVSSDRLTVLGDRVLFISNESNTQAARLFATDGTAAGTEQLAGGWVGNTSNAMSQPAAAGAGTAVYVQTSADATQRGLYSTDGTAAGTHRILVDSPDLHSPPFSTVGGRAFAIASHHAGLRIIETDGTTAGTRPIVYFAPPVSSNNPFHFTTVGDRPVIQVGEDGHPQLWSIDLSVPTGSISGLAFVDHNRNGTREGFESFLPGRAYIDRDGDAQWDANEPNDHTEHPEYRYLLDGLMPATYTVRFASFSLPVTNGLVVDLDASENVTDAHFLHTPATTQIWGTVFDDVDRDGIRDAGEPGAAGRTVFIDLNGNLSPETDEPSAMTAADGTYGFDNAPAGDVTVRVAYSAGWIQTAPPGFGNGQVVNAAAGEVREVPVFGVAQAQTGTVRGTVWMDWNHDGVRDAGDSPSMNHIVWLDLNNDGFRAAREPAAITNATGLYSFSSVTPGQYTIRASVSPDVQQTAPEPGQGYAITVPEGGIVAVPDFLIYNPAATPPGGRISGHVWLDRDSDGVADADEPGAWGRTIWLDIDRDGAIDINERVATTDADGQYVFPNLSAGTYYVRQALAEGWSQTQPAPAWTEVTLANGQQATVTTFGAHSDDATPPAVTDVFVNGMGWSQPFSDFIGSSGQGDATYGYRIPATGQTNELPWTNLNQVSLRFNENVNVVADDLVIRGVNVATYAGFTFAYDASTFTATWTLPAGTAFDRDKLLLDLDGGAGGVMDAAGNALDGEWTNPTAPAEGGADTFPSGNGVAGGDFHFRLNVLPGDVNGSGSILGTDVTLVRNAQGNAPGTGLYTIFKDVNGSASILGTDVTLVRNRQGLTLPAGEPTAPSYDLAFSTYLGGSAQEQVRDITTDAQGNIYVTGGGGSANFPTTAGAFDQTANGNFDVFVTKYTPSGQVIWSTLLGGPEYDRAYAIEVDASGHVYVAGRAGQGLPTTAGAFQSGYNGHYTGTAYGNQNAFVAKLTPDGSGLVFASYFGSYELIRDLAIDSSGDIYVAGSRRDTETGAAPPAAWFANAFQKTPNAGGETVIAKITSDGSQLLWATYYGGAGNDGTAPSIRVDSLKRPVVVGTTTSLDLATTAGAYDRAHNGGVDMYVAKFSADGSSLLYGTYLGGSGNEFTETHNLALDSAGNPYISGYTNATNFPTTSGALQSTYGGGPFDAFVAKLSADGSTLLASTYYGGSGSDGSEGINLDSAGNVYISGPSASPNLRMTGDAFRATNAGGSDMFVAKLSSNLSGLRYASYLGGPGNDSARTSWVDGAGNIYVAGHVEGGFFTRNAAQPLYGGATDNGIAKFVIL